MKILFVLKQKKNVETFLETIRTLVERGHRVTLAVQERGDERDEQYRDAIGSPLFAVVRCPTQRTDEWADVAPLLRSLRDCVHYQQPALHNAVKLQERTIHKLREDLRVQGDNQTAAGMLRELLPGQVQRLDNILGLAEQQLPTDPLHDEFLRAHAPDVLLLSPLVHFGSAQADLAASARAAGVPVGMLLYSWDNLSTKGCFHQPPDWMFVWNERQRREAHALHGFPEDRVVVAGAPRFDSFFDLTPQLTRELFHAALGLDPSRPTLLYVCSSRLISASEESFVRKWLAAVRASESEALRGCNVIVRPHPDIALLDAAQPVERTRWPSAPGLKGFLSRPFADDRSIVLRTTDRAQQGFYECIHHCAAVIGLNTSAELEAAIVGRPVFTVLAGESAADGQSSTLHFHYLLEENGGCVRVAGTLEEHTAHIANELAAPRDAAAIRRFVEEFLRPRGRGLAVSPFLAEAIERTFNAAGAAPRRVPARIPDADAEGEDAGPQIETVSPMDGGEEVVSLAIPKSGQTIQIRAAGGPGGPVRYRFDKTTVRWLRERVEIGDVVYDVGAGSGIYTLLAAKHFGAVVVAFEPGYAAFKALCDNLLLNGCDGSVMALPVVLADFEGVGELKYPTGMPGSHTHAVRAAPWHVKRAARDERLFKQPVLVMPLDQVLRRYGVPAPNHLRLGNPASAASTLDGAPHVLSESTLKTIFFTLPVEEGDAVAARLARFNWVVARHEPISRGRAHVLLARAAPIPAGPVGAL